MLRVADRVLVVGTTEEHVTLLAEMDGEVVEEMLAEAEEERVAQQEARRAALAVRRPAPPSTDPGDDDDRDDDRDDDAPTTQIALPRSPGAPGAPARPRRPPTAAGPDGHPARQRAGRRVGVRPRGLDPGRRGPAREDGAPLMPALLTERAGRWATRTGVVTAAGATLLVLLASAALAVDDPTAPTAPVAPTAPTGGLDISIGGDSPSSAITLILAITVLSIAPSLLLLVTSFTKIVVVLSLTRNALGLQNSPPNQVLTGLAFFLTLFVMGPVIADINHLAIQPYLDGQLSVGQAYDLGVEPLKHFLLANTRGDELKLMVGLSGEQMPADTDAVSMLTLVPAFVLSELKSAFIIGLVVFIPFLVLDMLVSAALMAMGMMMVPPVIVSLPFKLLLFVVVDGWALITTALVGSYGSYG